MNADTIIGLVAALGIGSFLGQYVVARTERRERRAAVLEALLTSEASRWGDSSFIELVRATRSLEVSALVAGLPKIAVKRYVALCQAARERSDFAGVDDDGEEVWAVDSALSDVVQSALEIVADLAWHPWTTTSWLRLRRHDREIAALPAGQLAAVERAWERNRLGRLPNDT